MVGFRPWLGDGGHARLVRWLWFVAAYLAVIVLIVWLGQHVDAPSAPELGWAE